VFPLVGSQSDAVGLYHRLDVMRNSKVPWPASHRECYPESTSLYCRTRMLRQGRTPFLEGRISPAIGALVGDA